MYTITTKEPGSEEPLAQEDKGSNAESMRRLSWAGWLPLIAGGVYVML